MLLYRFHKCFRVQKMSLRLMSSLLINVYERIYSSSNQTAHSIACALHTSFMVQKMVLQFYIFIFSVDQCVWKNSSSNPIMHRLTIINGFNDSKRSKIRNLDDINGQRIRSQMMSSFSCQDHLSPIIRWSHKVSKAAISSRPGVTLAFNANLF